MATCAYQACGEEFTPLRSNQRFHLPACRAAFWHEHRHGGVHKCPLCGSLHDPEERSVLDALEILIATARFYAEGTDVVELSGLRDFVARRRAIAAP